MIGTFRGKYNFLSNFYDSPVYFEGLIYKNVESAFQSAKVIGLSKRKQFLNLSASQAKKLGRCVQLRPDWEFIKDTIMEQCIKDKFNRNKELKIKLLNTKDEILVENNIWNDTYWGKCNGIGFNKLGKILMKVRNELK